MIMTTTMMPMTAITMTTMPRTATITTIIITIIIIMEIMDYRTNHLREHYGDGHVRKIKEEREKRSGKR
jgi:hypothetical protein